MVLILYGKEQSLLYDLLKAFDKLASSNESYFFCKKFYFHASTTCSLLPSHIERLIKLKAPWIGKQLV